MKFDTFIRLKRAKRNLSRRFLASRAQENVVFAIWVKEVGGGGVACPWISDTRAGGRLQSEPSGAPGGLEKQT